MSPAAAPVADRMTDWVAELERTVAPGAELTVEARAALLAVLAAFEAEDGALPEPALAARARLAGAAPVDEPAPAPHPPATAAEPALAGLAAAFRRRPVGQPAKSAA